MLLRELLEVLPEKAASGPIDLMVSGVTHNSRSVQPGSVFVCITGLKDDGHRYIPAAREKGAVAAVVERDVPVPEPMVRVRVPDSRLALGLLASAFWGFPTRRLRLVGVTGTNGKTTTAFLCRAVLTAAGGRVGLSGTIKNVVGDREYSPERTTPEAPELQRLFNEMVHAGCDYAVMEVSSHALRLNRVVGCQYDVAVFTNLTQDHLDFHRNLEDYLAAKAILFEGLTPDPGYGGREKGAVINSDDPAGARLQARTRVPVLTYGFGREAQIRGAELRVTRLGTSFRCLTPRGEFPVRLQLAGTFNAYNALAALAVATIEGIEPEAAVAALAQVTGVPGRFELVRAGQDFAVVVDYAHTPDGLKNVLITARQVTERGLILVFGCGGDRDRAKRPEMGRIAAELADRVIVTSDNPRSEDQETIMTEIVQGMGTGPLGERVEILGDRRTAIERAVELARSGDVVVIAGKGHEDYQIFRDRTIPFDDRLVAREALAHLGYDGGFGGGTA